MSEPRLLQGIVGGNDLPPPVRKILQNVPRAGSGVHIWTLIAAGALKPYRSFEEIEKIIRTLTANCGREVTEHELDDAIQNGVPLGARERDAATRKRRPTVDKEAQRNALLSYNGFGLADLENESHWPVWGRGSPFDFLSALYHQQAFLCCGSTLKEASTRTLAEWRSHHENLQFIVPHPMTARFGLTNTN